MRENQSFFATVQAWWGKGKGRKKTHNAMPKRNRSLLVEPLETRRLLSVSTWTGGAGSAYWNAAANWSPSGVPPSGSQLIFAGNSYTSTTNNLSNGTTFASIEFKSSNFTLAGNSITLTGGVTVDPGVSSSTISLAIGLSGTVPFNVYGAGLSDSGVLSGSGVLAKSGAGALTLSGANTYTGGTVLAGGTLSLGSANAIGTTGAISFTGGTLQATASNSTDYSSRFSTAAAQCYSIDTNGRSVTWATALTSSGGSLMLNDTAATKGVAKVREQGSDRVRGGGRQPIPLLRERADGGDRPQRRGRATSAGNR